MMFEKIKGIILALMTDGRGEHELTSYSFILTTIGLHALLIYHEMYCDPAIHTTITEYAMAMSANVAGHGLAYRVRD